MAAAEKGQATIFDISLSNHLTRAKNGTIYLFSKGIRRVVPDLFTANVVGFDLNTVELSDEELKSFPTGPPITRIPTSNRGPKNRTLVDMTVDQMFVLSTHDLHLKLYNPSIIDWKKRLVICSRFIAIPYDYDFTGDTIGCNWMSRSPKRKEDFSLLNRRYPPHNRVYGEDPRIIAHNDKLFVVFNHINVTMWPARRMGFVEVAAQDSNAPFLLMSEVQLITLHTLPKVDQKNWSPFFYQDTLLFVYSIEPHRVMRAYAPSTESNKEEYFSLEARTVALTFFSKFRWGYGEMRGGTPALLIPMSTEQQGQGQGQCYLSFFHSKKRVRGRRMTYFIGAYTFSATPPFHVLSISREPIVASSFYVGKLAPQPFDYILYPTSFTLDNDNNGNGNGNGNGTTVTLYYGRQDEDTWVASLQLSGLLASLVSVRSSTIGTSSITGDRDDLLFS
eukprot:gene205-371_t